MAFVNPSRAGPHAVGETPRRRSYIFFWDCSKFLDTDFSPCEKEIFHSERGLDGSLNPVRCTAAPISWPKVATILPKRGSNPYSTKMDTTAFQKQEVLMRCGLECISTVSFYRIIARCTTSQNRQNHRLLRLELLNVLPIQSFEPLVFGAAT